MTPEQRSDVLLERVLQRCRDMVSVQMGALGLPLMTENEVLIFELGISTAVLQTLLALEDESAR